MFPVLGEDGCGDFVECVNLDGAPTLITGTKDCSGNKYTLKNYMFSLYSVIPM